jgi:phosphatidate cytidylyltransferase
MLRIVSAAILLALVAVTLWALPTWATVVLATVAAALAGHELAHLALRGGLAIPVSFVTASSAVMVPAFLLSLVPTGMRVDFPAVLAALWLAAAALTLALAPPEPATLARAGVTTFVPLYVGIPLGVLCWVQWTFGPGATTWLLSVIAISDTAQYYTGRTFGRVKLAPVVSPSKTREGALGGFIAAGAAGGALAPWLLPMVPPAVGAGLGSALAATGLVGDLFESLLKRSVGMKDSSALIPGHGGVLDRIDSHLFAAPAFYLFVQFYR